MKTLFILNPAAGHGRAAARWHRMITRLRAGHPQSEVWHTQRPGDGGALARRGLEQGFEAIIGVGGDGTLGEVIDGFMSAPEPYRARAVAGTWAAGSGCDTARHLGLSPDDGVEKLLAMIKNGRRKLFDVGRVYFTNEDGSAGQRFFINIAAFGLAGDVARTLERSGKRFGGSASYFLSALSALARARARTVELTVDGSREPAARFHLGTVANSSTFGGGMRIAPGADMEDGSLDLVMVGGLSRFELLRHFPKIYRGALDGIAGVSRRKVRRVEASSPDEVWLNIDGEAVGRLPAVFEVLPRTLPFLLPQG